MKAEIIPIFSTPIYLSKINRFFSKKENIFFNKVKNEVYPNIGNKTSKNNFILNVPELKKLKEEIMLHVNSYFNNIINPATEVKPYITQSWLNYSYKKNYHHEHEHPNSLISGVLYIKANEKNDKIIFNNKNYSHIRIEAKEWNIFNAIHWEIPVEEMKIIIFPSTLRHLVSIKEDNNLRISLAFNVFIKGTIGSNKKLTELKI